MRYVTRISDLELTPYEDAQADPTKRLFLGFLAFTLWVGGFRIDMKDSKCTFWVNAGNKRGPNLKVQFPNRTYKFDNPRFPGTDANGVAEPEKISRTENFVTIPRPDYDAVQIALAKSVVLRDAIRVTIDREVARKREAARIAAEQLAAGGGSEGTSDDLSVDSGTLISDEQSTHVIDEETRAQLQLLA